MGLVTAMDPAALLLDVVDLSTTIYQMQGTYPAFADILSSIQSQLRLLETTLEQIQDWQHYADPQSEAQMLPGLQETLRAIGGALHRLREQLKPSTESSTTEPRRLDDTESNRQAEKEATFNEPSLHRDLVDLRQCTSLTHFALFACELPFGRIASQEAKEVVLAAKSLLHAHTSNGDERRSIINGQRLVSNQHGSVDFKKFITSVLEAEESLDASTTADRSNWQAPRHHADARPSNSISQSRYNDELFLPDNGRENVKLSASSRVPPPVPAKASSQPPSETGPALPPKLPEPPPKSTSSTLERQISRKPVQRSSTRLSRYAESVMSDMTIIATAGIEKSPGEDLERRYSLQTSRDTLEPTSTNTNTLFSQASRSLNSLAQDLDDVEINDNSVDSPPPYVNTRAPSFPRDFKRRNTQGSLESTPENANLIQAVRENQMDLLLALLDYGTEIDVVDPITKRTPIIEAANLRRSRMAQALIHAGARLHLKDREETTALHFAAFNGDSNLCVLLLNAGASPNEHNREGETPLDLAARQGHTETVIVLLNTWVTQNGHAATLIKGFLEATRSGNASTAQAFIERGVQPKKLKESWKPVVYAAQIGSIPMMDLMLAEKCNVKAKCPEGWSAIHYAAQAGHTAMVEKLLSWKVSWSNQTSKLGETALHIAILHNQISTAAALIYHKSASISMNDKDNHQAIHHAVRNGNVQLTTLLLNKGAKLDAQTNYGWTPMLIAAAYGHLALVAEFITRGVSVEDKLQQPSNNPGKKTNEAARKGYWCEIRWPHPGARALHLAIEFGHIDVVRTLIASGAKINEGDSKGWRPLHYAAWNCRPEIVELLLARGCSPHVTTDLGANPLSLGYREHGLTASMEERQQVYEILQAAMHARRKSTLTKIIDFKGIGARKIKDVEDRNRTWHTAELAAALYLSGQLDDSADSLSQLAPSTSSLSRQESKDQEEPATPTPASSSRRLTKRMSD